VNGPTGQETWARVGYAAWNPYHADKPAKVHRVTPAARFTGWLTACGMLYDDAQVGDRREFDRRCVRCSPRCSTRRTARD
jgi:hypothetical protein